LVYAGEQLVGRIYCKLRRSDVEQWFWGVNALTVDRTIGIAMHGYATDLDDAKDKLRRHSRRGCCGLERCH
jgi:hypothetical protein